MGLLRQLQRWITKAYSRHVSPARRRRPVGPIRRPSELDGWEGWWVAVKDGKVIEAAKSSRELVARLHEKGAKASGATAEYVVPATDSYRVGVG